MGKTMIDQLSWNWIAVMVGVPPLLAAPIAAVGWRREEMILGNLAGSIVIFSAVLGLILRESAALDRLTRQCLDAGFTCWPQPGAFIRYAIYAGTGLVEVMALFLVSLRVERRMRQRGYAPEWRR